jgi:hypothetical protein
MRLAWGRGLHLYESGVLVAVARCCGPARLAGSVVVVGQNQIRAQPGGGSRRACQSSRPIGVSSAVTGVARAKAQAGRPPAGTGKSEPHDNATATERRPGRLGSTRPANQTMAERKFQVYVGKVNRHSIGLRIRSGRQKTPSLRRPPLSPAGSSRTQSRPGWPKSGRLAEAQPFLQPPARINGQRSSFCMSRLWKASPIVLDCRRRRRRRYEHK